MKVYIIVNTDLKMSVGKIAGQVGHAVSKLIRACGNSKRMKEWFTNNEPKIVLKANEKTLNSLKNELKTKVYEIYDCGLTQIKENSLTVAITEPFTEEEIPDIIKKLKLL
jgi:PTH2 family peptidyl-tRNA hydrolase